MTHKSSDTGSFLYRNSLGLTLLVLLLLSLGGQIAAGHRVHNRQRMEHGALPIGLGDYLHSGHFVSATFENWESEFLQMGTYVLLTVWLRQKGSAESRPLDPAQEQDRIDPGPKPWPVRAGGLWKTLYANSLGIALLGLFAVSFWLHLEGSWRAELAERALSGKPALSLNSYLRGAEFWFESFQNWQSEFLAVLSLVMLSIFLRQQHSPESKPLEAPHSQTGG